ncbi:acetate--CoA ligase [Enteractinococcus helveticum]|uniref:acetate--CoA ligase n=1 Tax=Enteractinococcus helveticum TaxID=1837282 RepID=A0A1B7LVX1_9MICC|nr:acetate--CoA ligase [Enteractinococcus helveticum]OAV59162.1 acetyl-coenzyme A synthetase [Enteractinococcus helveticum]
MVTTHEIATQQRAQELYAQADKNHLDYWASRSRTEVHWDTPFTEILDWSNPPFARWFADGTTNACYNAVDRHVAAGNGDRVALYFEGEPGDSQAVTYAELLDRVSQTANALEALGVTKGDRVAIYLPMLVEAVVSILACARIGAVHSVVFGGFSAEALRSRIDDAEAKVVITADGSYRRGKPNMLKPIVDDALANNGHTVEHVLVVQRNGEDINWVQGRDRWFHDVVDAQPTTHELVWHEAEHPLFILYTSGTTGTPKGILHTTGGYLTQVTATARDTFDLQPETDVFWCTADVGWVTGHSYIVYGPMSNGATQVIYEGTPDAPHRGRWWEIVEKYGVTILYTAPTAIRAAMKWGRDIADRYDLSSLRLLGSVGEAINPEAWYWYREVIGQNNGAGTVHEDGTVTPGPRQTDPVAIADTWWQTETGAHILTPLPALTAEQLKPGSAQRAVPGIAVDVVDEEGNTMQDTSQGFLVIREPWPAMARTIWGDNQRFVDTYWSRFDGMYFAGDGARFDEDGDIWLLGRVDDVMNVSGHRLSTTEIESALVAHPLVAEAAVVGAADETTGQAIYAFVILTEESDGVAPDEAEANLREHVASHIGPIAKPRRILITSDLPKTRSGKIMRRLLKDAAEGKTQADTTALATLADPAVMEEILNGMRG